MGAPKINMDIGQLVYASHSLKDPFIRLVEIFVSYSTKLNFISFRVSSLKGCCPPLQRFSCKVCFRMIDSSGTSNPEVEKKYFLESCNKSKIPGFHTDSKRRQAKDINLPPLYTPSSKVLKYGDTSNDNRNKSKLKTKKSSLGSFLFKFKTRDLEKNVTCSKQKKSSKKMKRVNNEGFQENLNRNKKCLTRKQPPLSLTVNKFSVLENENCVGENQEDDVCLLKVPSSTPLCEKSRRKKKLKSKGRKGEKSKKNSKQKTASAHNIFPKVLRCCMCFISHFPIAKICKKIGNTRQISSTNLQTSDISISTLDLIHKRIKFIELSICHTLETTKTIIGLKGGGGTNSSVENVMIKRTIENARKHGINLKMGCPNKADGNCTIESVLENINNRECFQPKLPLFG